MLVKKVSTVLDHWNTVLRDFLSGSKQAYTVYNLVGVELSKKFDLMMYNST